MSQTFQLRRGTTAEWVFANPILQAGELGYETSTNRIKVGTGVDPWSSLIYVEASANSIDWSNIDNKPTAFPPTSHASSHETGGIDALTPGAIGAAPAASPTFTGVITVSAGSGTTGSYLPSVVFSGDPNTGIQQIGGADTFSTVVGGAERMRVSLESVDIYQASGGSSVSRVRLNSSAGSSQFAVLSYGAAYAAGTVLSVGAGGNAMAAVSGSLGIATLSQSPLTLGTNSVERFRIKPTGSVRFVPLSSDPASGNEAGDVYYSSTTNKLRVYNGTTWIDLH